MNKEVSYTSLCIWLGVEWWQICEKQINLPLLLLFRYCTWRLPASASYLITQLLPTYVWGSESRFIDGPFYRYLVQPIRRNTIICKISDYIHMLNTFIVGNNLHSICRFYLCYQIMPVYSLNLCTGTFNFLFWLEKTLLLVIKLKCKIRISA